MLTRFVRIQLIIFTTISIVGVALMIFQYIQAPTMLGIDRLTVKVELPNSGGLYRFSNVTLRGVQIGKVTDVSYTRAGAEAILSLDNSPKIPTDLQAEVRSVSAVGEQYVDLVPRADTAPYLRDGSVIAAKDTTVPQQVGPVLDQVSALLKSIPKDKLHDLLDEAFKGFNGASFDFSSLIDSSTKISGQLNSVAGPAQTLIADTSPLLDSQAETTDALRTWARGLAGVTDQLAANDSQIRSILQTGPGAAQEISRLLNQVKPTLPVLLANLTTIGQIGVTYNPSIEQLLVLLPPYVAGIQTYGSPKNNASGYPLGEFSLTNTDPVGCTVGFLPPSQWRSPADTTTIDTPDNLYCKLPQDSAISVRGARNYPCMGHPGKRAPTVQICDSDQPYEPLAQRQHILGPYPTDPSLLAQGLPPDDRVNPDANIYGPLHGTQPSAGSPPAPESPDTAPSLPSGPTNDAAQPPPTDTPPPVNPDSTPVAAPSSFNSSTSGPLPGVAVAQYNPRTGEYLAADGKLYSQSDLATDQMPSTWQELILGRH